MALEVVLDFDFTLPPVSQNLPMFPSFPEPVNAMSCTIGVENYVKL